MADEQQGIVITRFAKHHVSMGDYEFHEFGGSISAPLSHFDGQTTAEAMETLAIQLDEALATDVENASLVTPHPDSYIHAYAQRS